MSAELALRARSSPLTPSAVVGEGEAAVRLARRLLALPDEALSRLSGVRAPGLLAVCGAEADLPWADGVRYLGRDPDAPALLLPTALGPELPVALLERALLRRAPGVAAPLAVLVNPLRLVPLGGARPIARAHLAGWTSSR